jgi:hypothetical protein
MVLFVLATTLLVGCRTGSKQEDGPGPVDTPQRARPHAAAEAGKAAGHFSLARAGDNPEAEGEAKRQAALAGVDAVHFSAASGGVYRSPDGSLVIEIPPGALAADADIKFARLDPSTLHAHGGGVPGLAIVADWGNARFKPGAAMKVKAAVDQRFVDAVERLAPGRASEVGLTRNAKGGAELELAVHADPNGRPESIDAMPIGDGTLGHLASMPTEVTRAGEEALAKAQKEPLPTPVPGKVTARAQTTGDPLVDAYPPLPQDYVYDPEYHPIDVAVTKDGKTRVPIRSTLSATVAELPVAVMCEVSGCKGKPFEALEESVRFNKAINARRLPPESVRWHAHQPLELDCAATSP